MDFYRLLKKGIKKKFGWIGRLFNKLFKTLLVIVIILTSSVLFHFYTDEELTRDILVHYTYEDGEYINTGINEDITEEIDDFITKQDKSLINQFKKQNWKIVINDKIPPALSASVNTVINAKEENRNYYSLNGLTVPRAKIIYINNKNTKRDILNTFMHEFGHFIDYQLGYPSVSFEFEELYEINKYCDIYDEHQSENSTEFFAASYLYYHTKPETLKGRAPSVYEFIDDTINNINEIDAVPNMLKSSLLSLYAHLKVNARMIIGQFWK